MLAREQAQATTLYNLREAISQALGCLQREDIATAKQLLRDALDDNR